MCSHLPWPTPLFLCLLFSCFPLSLYHLCPYFYLLLSLSYSHFTSEYIHISFASDAGKQSHLQRVSAHAWHDFLLRISVTHVIAAAAAAAVTADLGENSIFCMMPSSIKLLKLSWQRTCSV